MDHPDQIRDEARAATADFLLIDAGMALSFLQLADKTDNPETRDRRRKMAIKAYDKIIALMPRVALTGDQRALLERKLLTVRSRLEPV